ncbi:type I restriction-modification system specificity subunit S [Photobacterium aphoticum]|uniref:Type I restriction-modification system specificity subunit S n=1 Tax=Photobacterium aphoticum TaxID=754436 RepID=A0A090REX0_9GAMM|nr:type I restriction-modification system specificity subunit S [Photobacterium aphoticum]
MTEQQLLEGWQMVKFGDIAKHISKRVEPTETDLEVYVGLEHLDPDSLKIKRHGVPSDVAGQKLLVKKGQIIFGKRRAYQRKIAVADWDCICSAHAMVLEANPQSVIPEFLPFFMQSDAFMNRAVAISEGSLSPTIKWKTLSNQKFKIPSIEKQQLLVELLSSQQKVIAKYDEALNSLEQLLCSVVSEQLHIIPPFGRSDTHLPDGWTVKELSQIANVERGKFTPRPRNNPIYYDGEYPFIQTGDVGRANLFITEHSQTLNDKGLDVSKLFDKGTIFITIAANIGDVAISTYEVAATDSVVAIQPNKDIDALWLLFYLRALKSTLDRVATESAQKNINLGVLKPLKIAIPPHCFQVSIGQKLLSIKKQLDLLSDSKRSVRHLLKGIL